MPATITIYDVSKYLYVSKDLAERYLINTDDLVGMCKVNRKAALSIGRDDVAQAWSMAEMISLGIMEMEHGDDVAGQQPFSKNLLESLIFHFAKIHDVQTAAMLCCAFGRHCPDQLYRTSSSSGSKSVSQSVSTFCWGSLRNIWELSLLNWSESLN